MEKHEVRESRFVTFEISFSIDGEEGESGFEEDESEDLDIID